MFLLFQVYAIFMNLVIFLETLQTLDMFISGTLHSFVILICDIQRVVILQYAVIFE